MAIFPDKAFEGEQALSEPSIFVSLTYDALDPSAVMARVKSPKAGAVVLFAGTFIALARQRTTDMLGLRLKPKTAVGCTRDSFASKTVTHLAYSTYAPLALRSLQSIARIIHAEHHLVGIAVTHRLGRVDIGEESILIAVSSPHRAAAWKAGEECLEKVKASVEIWKEEWFEDGGIWRSNRDGQAGVPVNINEDTAGQERQS